MGQQEYPTLNDYAPSWADIITSFQVYGGQLLNTIDYKSLNWGSTVEVGEQRGASGGRVMKRTRGQVSHEASAEMYRSGHRRLLRALMEKAPTRGNQVLVSLVAFDILIQHTPPGESDIYVTKIKGCRLLGHNAAFGEGSDADVIPVTLNPMEVVNIIDTKEVVLL